MNFRNQQALDQQSSSNIVAVCSPAYAAVPTPVSGLHEGLAVVLQRIAQVNNALDGTLQRIHGPRPVSTQEGKNPETPSIVSLAANVESELSLLERLSTDLCQFIG